MDIYNYHPVTGEYLGSSTADESPLEPGVFHIPADATELEPPTIPAGKAAVFSENNWSVVEDHRGTTYWTPDAVSHTVTTLGALPDGAILIAPPEPQPYHVLSFENGQWVSTSTATYAENRAMNYPSLGNQLDMIWHAINAGSPLDAESSFYKAIAAVKAAYPKPDATTP